MQRGETSLPHVAHSVWSKGRSIILIHTGAQQAPMQHNGQEQSVGQILFGALGSEFHRRSQGGQWGSMSLTPDDLAAVGEVVVGREVTVPSVARIIQPPPQLMSHLLRLHAAAGHLAETVPDILAHPEIARA